MKRFKNFKVLAGLGLVLLGVALIAGYYFRTPTQEISRPELNYLVQKNQITEGRVLPTPYNGVYHVEGTRRAGSQTGNFFVTTHLDEDELAALTARKSVKMELAGLGRNGQWVNIISTFVIGGLVIMLIV